MGYGDEIMATGMAKGLAARGQLAAFGDGRRIIWSPQSKEIFWGNPNIARPGFERRLSNLVWIDHYRGHRHYAKSVNGRWIWAEGFRPIPGEIYLQPQELRWAADAVQPGFVLIEPNVKKTAPNKQWPFDRYQAVADSLRRDRMRVVQLVGPRLLRGVEFVATPTFRHAMAVLSLASTYVGPEGGLHHAAAALGVGAVVIFGGFIHPNVTGYPGHANLAVGAVGCGTIGIPCPHCLRAMRSIPVHTVVRSAKEQICRSSSRASTSRMERSTSSSSSSRDPSLRAGRRTSSRS